MWLALCTMCKGNMTVAEYVGRMRSLGDNMAAAGRTLDDDELVEYILTGLDEECDSLMSSVLVHADPIFVGELYSQMLAFETRIELRNKNNGSRFSANAVSRGRGRGGPGRSGYGGNQGDMGSNSPAQRGGRGGFNPRQVCRDGNNSGSSKRPTCQVCHKVGHTIDRCWYRYDESYTPDPRHAAAATNSYIVDTDGDETVEATRVLIKRDKFEFKLNLMHKRNKYMYSELILP
jgi:hypothetical protein